MGTTATRAQPGTSPGEGNSECQSLTQFGDLTGKTVKVYTSIVEVGTESQKSSNRLFTRCTGAKIAHEGSGEFAVPLVVFLGLRHFILRGLLAGSVEGWGTG